MRARNVLLALIIVVVGMSITASRHGVFAGWERALRDVSGGIEELVGAVSESWPPGEWQAIGGGSSAFPAQKFSSLIIENAKGSITVTGREQDKVQMKEIRYGRGETQDEARRNGHAVFVEKRPSGEALVISIHGGRDWWRRARVDLQITTPPNLDVAVRTTSGPVQVRGMKGAVNVQNISGDTSVRGGSEAKVTSISGAVRLENVSGEMRLSTVSGSVRAGNLRGPLSARTISGSIYLDGYAGSPVDLKTTSGDVNASLSQPMTGQFFARSVSGSIWAAIPGGSDCIVDLSSRSGHISCQVPSFREYGNGGQQGPEFGPDLERPFREGRLAIPRERIRHFRQRHVQGIIGSGRGRLELHSISGSVMVTTAPAHTAEAELRPPQMVPPTPAARPVRPLPPRKQ
jgi:DUF4097 and DUF4098 domain-containing protein YvlB